MCQSLKKGENFAILPVVKLRPDQFGAEILKVINTCVRSSSDNGFKDESESYTAYLNEAGYVTRCEWADGSVANYTYDDANRLILVKEGEEQEEYIWENGDIVETRYTYPDSDPYVHHYSYFEEYPNKENFDLYHNNFAWDEELGFIGRLGVRNSHLIKQCRGERDTKDDFDVTYELDADGFVTAYEETYSPTEASYICTVTHIDAK